MAAIHRSSRARKSDEKSGAWGSPSWSCAIRGSAAFFACRKLQAEALGLNAFQLTPSELSSPLHVPGGDDSRRAEMIALVQKLAELGLSQFVPAPRAAIAAAEAQAPAADGARLRAERKWQ